MNAIIEPSTIPLGKRVRVYFNLHKKTYSIQDALTKRVISYADSIALKDCKFIVSKAGNARVRATKRKSVHAYIEGNISFATNEPIYIGLVKGTSPITYNPYLYTSFVHKESLIPVETASECLITRKDVLAKFYR